MAGRARSEVRDGESERMERLRRTGLAIRRARGELTQTELGERLAAYLGEAVPQTTVSRWESGSVALDLETVRALELALDLAPGVLFHSAGYAVLDLDTSAGEDVLRVDPNIDDSLRDTALSQYRVWVTLSDEIRKARRPQLRR